MSKKILVFHHTDLDGIGVKIIGTVAAQCQGLEPETFACGYNSVDEIIQKRLNENLSDVVAIIIGDISVNRETAAMLNNLYMKEKIDVILKDHHATAEWLNEYVWADVSETDADDILRCGTFLLAKCYWDIFMRYKKFIETVDDWDTWKWSKNGNTTAKDLNTLFQAIGEQKFTEYILELYENSENYVEELFNDWARGVVKFYSNFVKKSAKNYEYNMWTMDIKVNSKQYKTGVIFVNHNLSEIAEIILKKHPEIDILMMIAFPKSISYRTQKNLDLPLGELAKIMTGSGGGHPQAAGSTINPNQFIQLMDFMVSMLSDERVEIVELSKE